MEKIVKYNRSVVRNMLRQTESKQIDFLNKIALGEYIHPMYRKVIKDILFTGCYVGDSGEVGLSYVYEFHTELDILKDSVPLRLRANGNNLKLSDEYRILEDAYRSLLDRGIQPNRFFEV